MTYCHPESALLFAFLYGFVLATLMGSAIYCWLIKTGDKE